MIDLVILGKIAGFTLAAAGEWLVSTGLESVKEETIRESAVSRAVAAALDDVAGRYPREVGALLDNGAWDGAVGAQLARCIPGAPVEPDPGALAEAWRKTPGMPEQQALLVAGDFLTAVRARLKTEPIFFQGATREALEELAARVQESVHSTQMVLARLALLESSVSGALRTYLDRVADAGRPTAGWRHAAEQWTLRKLREAIPADWFAKAVERAMRDNRSGYVHVVGEPGVGKSTVAAQLVATRACPFHWNDRRGGFTTTDQFGACLGRQLIACGLAESTLGTPADRDATSIAGLFELAATVASRSSPLLVVVDALDEAEAPLGGGTPLSLPDLLPDHVYVVVTTRPHRWASMSSTIEDIDLDKDTRHHGILKTFIWERAKAPEFDAVLARLGAPRRDFVDTLYARAAGSFIYARSLLDDLVEGRFSPTTLAVLPAGLTRYYALNIDRVLDNPVQHQSIATMYALCVAKVAVTFDDLAAIVSAYRAASEVSGDLEVWRHYVEADKVDGETVYRVFHPSFADYLMTTDVVERLRPHLRGLDAVIEERIQDRQLAIVHRGRH